MTSEKNREWIICGNCLKKEKCRAADPFMMFCSLKELTEKKEHTITISDSDCFHLRCFLSNWLTETGYMHGDRTEEAQAVFNLWEKL